MNREDVQKLLGGYATGTLTPEEQQALFSAALEDQELFDALAREQSLRDLLEDPGARAQLLAALDEKPEPWYARWWRPAALALASASVAVLAVVAIRQNARPVPAASVSTMAEVKPPPAAPVRTIEADQAKPAPVGAPSADAVRLKRRAAPPEQEVKEKAAQQAVPEPAAAPPPPPPTVAETRPSGVAGGAPSGVPAAAPPAPALQTETLAKDQLLLAAAGNQRARMLFFGPPLSSGFLDAQNAPEGNAQAEAATGARDEKKQPQKATEQARTMMRSTANALAARATLPGATPLGIRYTLLRRAGDDAFVEVAPGGLQAGDTVEVRFEANQDGFLSVLGGGDRPIAAIHVSRRMPYTTVPIGPGPDQLTVRFSRVPLTGAVKASGNVVETPADASDRATYVASANALGDPLVFTIALR